jgi:type I restriction enzyme S subunit
MSWEKVILADVTNNIQTGPFGSQLHQADYSEEGTPVVMPKDLIDGKISEQLVARVGENYVNKLSRHKIEKGDILYARRGDVGRCAFTTRREEGWLCGTGCLRVTVNPKIANPQFVFYQLQRAEIVGWVEKHAVGSTMLNLNTSILSAVPLEIPSLETQGKIVGILKSYDDLIENNQKQIKLLEEAAQRLYKEWFVDLKFPGYEDVKIVDGIPEGWKKGTLGEVALFKRGKTIKKSQVQEGNVPVVAGGLEPAYYHNKANTVAPVITVSGSGANAGFSRLYNVDVFASDCSFADRETTPYLYFVYVFLKANKLSIDALQKGSAQPHVYAKDINALKMVIPSFDKLENYCRVITPYFERIKKLQKQIEISMQARDRLLPKLMSGELEA